MTEDEFEGEFEESVIDVNWLMRINRKRKEQGEDALTPREWAYLRHVSKVMAVVAARFRKSLEGREAITALGQEIYELLPEELQERWADLTPAELTMLSLVFPEQLPPNARALLGDV